jgi:phosphotransferase system enzyme I (PtsI)
MAVGPVKVIGPANRWIPRRHVAPDTVDAEIARLRDAIERSRAEIEEVRAGMDEGVGADYGLILDAHMLMHRDELIVDAAIRAIRTERRNAEWALRRTVDDLVEQLGRAGSGYFRERAHDVEHVGQHIMRWLTEGQPTLPSIDTPTILVAEDLSPTDAARLAGMPVLAVVTDLGTATSHTAILARTLEIPAVVGVSNVTSRVGDGDVVIVDALHGLVVLDADEAEQERARERATRYLRFTQELRDKRVDVVATADGVRVELQANVELPAEAALAVDSGADGIGLYRTEVLYLDRVTPPTEEEQLRVYRDVVAVTSPRVVTFRTYDLGGDKLPQSERLPRTLNPALGLRALRLSLARPDLLRPQVRAILRASAHGPVRLMFPLVTTVDDIRRARAIVDEIREELAKEGVDASDVPIGIMVEVPSAALLAGALAKVCDFFSVGTNDLVQYTLALDRTNPQVAHLARTLDPAVLKLLDLTARAADEAGIPLAMCGDMAADPFAIPIALGLGYRTFSIPLAREVIGRIDSTTAERAAREALDCADAADVEAIVTRVFGDALADLWREEGLEV